MAASVTAMLPIGVVVLPFATAAVLAAVGSWRVGTWLNLGSAVVLFLLTCALPWQTQVAPPVFVAGAATTQLVLLTSLVAMVTSGFALRLMRTALEQQVLNRRRIRLHHVACQGLVGAIMLALLSDLPALTWLALAIATCGAAAVIGAVRTPEAAAAATQLHLLCGAGLMLALVGTLLLHLAVEPHASLLRWSTLHAASLHQSAFGLACIFLVVGYAALAGLLPLHLWLPDAMEHGTVPGAIIVGTLMVNAPLLALLHLRAASSDLLIAVGLVSLLLGAASLFIETDKRRRVAFAGIAQLGVVAFAFAVGAVLEGLLYLILLVLARASVLLNLGSPRTSSVGMVVLGVLPLFAGIAQLGVVAFAFAVGAVLEGLLYLILLVLARASVLLNLGSILLVLARASVLLNLGSPRTSSVGMVVLGVLPLFALFLIAGATVDRSPWLLLPLGAGVVLTSWGVLRR